MLQIVLIRPGSTDYDQQELIQGALDVPLNDQGRLEVAQVIEQLSSNGIETIHAPAHQPAQETGRQIAKALGVKFKKLDKMQNLNLGLWQGLPVKDVRRKQPKVYRKWRANPESVCPPDGEMLGDAEQRVRLCVSKLLKRHREGTIGLVLSEPLASIVRHLVQRDELGDLWKKTNGHGRWEVLEVDAPEVLAYCES